MRCEPRTQDNFYLFIYMKTFALVILLALSNVLEYHHLVELPIFYTVLLNLIINNVVSLLCLNKELHYFVDFIWKLFTTLSYLHIHCFQIKVALDTIMISKEVLEHFLSKPRRSSRDVAKVDSPKHYIGGRQSIHHQITDSTLVESKENESFLVHKIFTLNLGKSPSRRKSRERTRRSEDIFSNFNINDNKPKTTSNNEKFWSWGSTSKQQSSPFSQKSPFAQKSSYSPELFNSSQNNSSHCSKDSISPNNSNAKSSLLKPPRFSFSPSRKVRNEVSTPNPPGADRSTSLSHTLFYSGPKVIYVQTPNSLAEQNYLKVICYLFTLVIVYIIYNEYRLTKFYSLHSHHP